MAGPGLAQGRVSFVHLVHQLAHRLPAELLRHLRPHVEIDPRDEQISPGSHEPRNASQAISRLIGRHVTQEAVGDHDVLRTEKVAQPRIGGIGDVPLDPVADPVLDTQPAVRAVEEALHLHLGQPLEDGLADHFGSTEGVASQARGFEDFGR